MCLMYKWDIFCIFMRRWHVWETDRLPYIAHYHLEFGDETNVNYLNLNQRGMSKSHVGMEFVAQQKSIYLISFHSFMPRNCSSQIWHYSFGEETGGIFLFCIEIFQRDCSWIRQKRIWTIQSTHEVIKVLLAGCRSRR